MHSSSGTTNAGEDFKCNICLNIASDAVVTLCGHLFCWPCLYTWLHKHARYKECPLCKGAVSDATLVPIYSWGSKDPAQKCGTNIPPRPSAKRIESERQRRHRCERGMDAASSAALTNDFASHADYAHGMYMLGMETRASWLQSLRALRGERLAWPLALMQGLTSRELLQQRRQPREAPLSSRFVGEDGLPQGFQRRMLQSQPALQHHRCSGCSDCMFLPGSSNHTAQYLSTMSSILSSMEVFANALELSSSSSLRRSMPCSLHTLEQEQNIWQSSMRALLTQMERLMVQLQSIQPNDATRHAQSGTNNPALLNRWSKSLACPPRGLNDGRLSDRGHGSSRTERGDVDLATTGQCHRSVLSMAASETSNTITKSRKRWEATRVSR